MSTHKMRTPRAHAVVIAGFPGVGKSHIARTRRDLVVLDSDSSRFSWLGDGRRDPAFPDNYVRHVRAHLDKADVILVSSHDVVRCALERDGLAYTLVYPEPGEPSRQEYLDRYMRRGSPPAFVGMMARQFDRFIEECDAETHPTRIRLTPDAYLGDVLPHILIAPATGCENDAPDNI